jgi:hypothetical protein
MTKTGSDFLPKTGKTRENSDTADHNILIPKLWFRFGLLILALYSMGDETPQQIASMHISPQPVKVVTDSWPYGRISGA